MVYDTIIKNGTLYDGSGDPPYKADIAVKDGVIIQIGTINTEAKITIDATGLIIAPGFVDIHSHSDYYLLINRKAESKVRQGVTTEIGGNCGYSPAPISGDLKDERIKVYKNEFGIDLDFSTMDGYHSALNREGISVNFASQIGHNTLRGSVVGMDNRPPTKSEMSQMSSLITEAMNEGAYGLSLGLIYPPSCYSGKEELISLCTVAGKHKGVLSTHIRSEGDMLIEAIKEVIHICEKAEISLQISHLKTSGKKNWGKIDQVFEIIQKAKEAGLNIECDRYPYTASNTGLLATLPLWVYEGGVKSILTKLKDKKNRIKITKEFCEAYPKGDNWERISISQVFSKKNKAYEGKTIKQAAQLANKECAEFVFDILIDENTNVEIILFSMCEENLVSILKKPYVMIGSDSGARADYGKLGTGMPHPRTFGTFPRAIKKYALDMKLFNLESVIKKMTKDPCRKFNINRRGELKAGMYADIVAIDIATIKDTSTYDNPVSYPEGIKYVFVNGALTVKDGTHSGKKAGMVLKRGFNTRCLKGGK